MKQKITGYLKDEENHWVAKLECGHGQHLRHDPPWMEREWVTTPEGRASRLGLELNCVRCDEMGEAILKALTEQIKRTLPQAYEDAGISGLCDEGRWEAAFGKIEFSQLKDLLQKALRKD